MSEDLEAVLRRVAAGELTPEQALAEMDKSAPSAPGAPPGSAPGASAGTSPGAPFGTPSGSATRFGPAANDEQVTSIRLNTSYRSVTVMADPTVAQVHVVGDHTIERLGSVLQISASGPLDDGERASGREQNPTAGRFSFKDLPRTIAWARSWRDHQLTIRVNPALAVTLDVTGADVKLTGLVAGVSARLVACSLKLDKTRCQLDLSATSSSLKLTAIPTGNSRLKCESSSARLVLPAGTDLTITASNRMGQLSLPDRQVSTLPFEGETSEVTIGDGRDHLSLEAVMSSVTVSAQAWGKVPS